MNPPWKTIDVTPSHEPIHRILNNPRLAPVRRLAFAWHIHYGDVRVGTIARRVGNPHDTDPWEWTCGFYPGSHPRECTSDTSETFDQARADFEAAWVVFSSKRTEADFQARKVQLLRALCNVYGVSGFRGGPEMSVAFLTSPRDVVAQADTKELSMSERAIAFVEEWVSENIHAEGYEPEGDHSQAAAFAAQCLASSKAEGITEAEMKRAFDDLTQFMAAAIETANDDEVARQASKDDSF